MISDPIEVNEELIIVCVVSDGESAAVCEIIHVKSESEGRPERVFQLCCRSVSGTKTMREKKKYIYIYIYKFKNKKYLIYKIKNKY